MQTAMNGDDERVRRSIEILDKTIKILDEHREHLLGGRFDLSWALPIQLDSLMREWTASCAALRQQHDELYVLDYVETAQIIKQKESWVKRHARDLEGVKRGRSYWFSLVKLRRYLSREKE